MSDDLFCRLQLQCGSRGHIRIDWRDILSPIIQITRNHYINYLHGWYLQFPTAPDHNPAYLDHIWFCLDWYWCDIVESSVVNHKVTKKGLNAKNRRRNGRRDPRDFVTSSPSSLGGIVLNLKALIYILHLLYAFKSIYSSYSWNLY